MPLRTYSIQTLGCKVNQYEAEQMAALLRARGLAAATEGQAADLRIVHTCSVTVQAAAKSRQLVRRAGGKAIGLPVLTDDAAKPLGSPTAGRTIVSGCWATSDPAAAAALPGVDAVLTHHEDIAAGLERLLGQWLHAGESNPPADSNSAATTLLGGKETNSAERPIGSSPLPDVTHLQAASESLEDNGWIYAAGAPADQLAEISKSRLSAGVNYKIARSGSSPAAVGASRLPLLDVRQTGRQRAVMKIQDGCDAHCTYCIIPRLRPALWSKPVDDAVEEAQRLVQSGHVELVLTGIFLGAYGRETALRRRWGKGDWERGGVGEGEKRHPFPPLTPSPPLPLSSPRSPLAELIESLCTRVSGLRRLRLSSLEPGDLSDDLLGVLRDHPQVVPHFHLPLQSGSDRLLRRMNRQYTRGDFLDMVERVNAAFDRPALTTDIIVGFPGEDEQAFSETVDVVRRAGFIHVHAFSFSPRPGTAAARWVRDFVRGPVVNERIETLNAIAAGNSLAFRRSFLGQTATVLVEREKPHPAIPAHLRHGRCERYFPVSFDRPESQPGDFVTVRIDAVRPDATYGTCLEQLP